MADIKRVPPEEAKALLDAGYVYVDVRTQAEFDAGHVPGAYNVPINVQGPGGMQPNPDFIKVMESLFAKDQKIVLGCRSGARSLRAAQMLGAAGFETLVDLQTGFEGSRDAFGRPNPGWRAQGLPVEMGQPEGLCYEDVSKKTLG